MKRLIIVLSVVAGLTAATALAQMSGGMMGGQQGTMMEQQQSPEGSIGAALFRDNCAGCHPNGGNIIAPDLPIMGSRKLASFKAFDAFIRAPKMPDGSEGAMPAFSASKISDKQAKELYQFVTTTAWSGTRGGSGMGPGMMGGMGGVGMMDDQGMPMMDNGMGYGMGQNYYGMRGGGWGMMGAGAFGALDLTAEQRAKINKIQDELRKQHWALMGKMMDEQAKLRDLYYEDTPDAKKIGAVSDSIFALRRQMIESRVDAFNRIREVLTKDQREQLDKLRRRGWGMMGPGYGHGPMMGP